MKTYFDELIDGTLPPGRYRLGVALSVRAIRDELASAGWTVRVVDGAAMVDRAALFDEFATACDFPDWFGDNWDAFADCLRDLSWLPPAPMAILWLRCGVLAARDPDLYGDAGRVIDAAIAARVAADLPELAILYPAALDLASFDPTSVDSVSFDPAPSNPAPSDPAAFNPTPFGPDSGDVNDDGGPPLRPVR